MLRCRLRAVDGLLNRPTRNAARGRGREWKCVLCYGCAAEEGCRVQLALLRCAHDISPLTAAQPPAQRMSLILPTTQAGVIECLLPNPRLSSKAAAVALAPLERS